MLDDAIEHAKQVAESAKTCACAEDHRRLYGWLQELKVFRSLNT